MLKTILLLHFAVFLAGWTGVFGRLIDYDAFTLVFFRMVIAAIVIAMYVKLSHRLQQIAFRVIVQEMFAGMLLTTHLVFFYLAIKTSNVAIGTITLASSPFWSALIEPLIIKNSKFSFKNIIFSFLVMIGILLIFSLDTKFRLGILIGLISAFSASLFAIVNKKATAGREPYTAITYEMIGAALLMLIIAPVYYYAVGTQGLYFSANNLFYLLILATVFTALLYLLMIVVSQKVSAFSISLCLNLEPVYAIVIAMWLFDEQKDLNYSFYLGIVLIACSVVLQNLNYLRNKK